MAGPWHANSALYHRLAELTLESHGARLMSEFRNAEIDKLEFRLQVAEPAAHHLNPLGRLPELSSSL